MQGKLQAKRPRPDGTAATPADVLEDLELHSCPTPGACGGMYTANTMATAIEAMVSIGGQYVPFINLSLIVSRLSLRSYSSFISCNSQLLLF